MDLIMAWKLAIAAIILLSCSNEGEGMPHNMKQFQHESTLLQRLEVTSHHESSIDGQILEISQRTTRQASSHGEVIDSEEESQSFERGPYNHNELGNNHGIPIDGTHMSMEVSPHKGFDRKEFDHRELGPGHGIVIDDEDEYEDNRVDGETRQQETGSERRSEPREI